MDFETPQNPIPNLKPDKFVIRGAGYLKSLRVERASNLKNAAVSTCFGPKDEAIHFCKESAAYAVIVALDFHDISGLYVDRV